MKLAKLALVALGIAVLGVAGEASYQRHVIGDAKIALVSWIEKKEPLFESRFGEEEKRCREFCGSGVTMISSGEASWTYVELAVTNREGKIACVPMRKGDGRWYANFLQ
ncbi:MAG: hypothetical protein IPL39_12610 [Opitutaceae bacterium]|nr:hypothetical protein [Opitutaceae bacterium]